jgi:capsule polysaccharide export protein KpsE/RkpR
VHELAWQHLVTVVWVDVVCMSVYFLRILALPLLSSTIAMMRGPTHRCSKNAGLITLPW